MKQLKTVIVTLLLAVAGLFGYQQVATFGSGQEANFNMVDSLSRLSTTTTAVAAANSSSPVKLLTLDPNRRYALIQNNSTARIWLFATSTDLGAGVARTRFGTRDGIILEGKSGSSSASMFELTPDKMIYGHIWASSTLPSKSLIINWR